MAATNTRARRAPLFAEYLNLDDCYVKDRDAQGVLQPDPKTFSKGMKSLGDYAHSKGMKFGVCECSAAHHH